MASSNDYSVIGFGGGYSTFLPAVERTYLTDIKSGLDTTSIVDETETDIDFMFSLYRNTHPQYYLGGWVVKPIVEILLHFTGVPKPKSDDKKLSELLTKTYSARKSQLVQAFRETGIIGECFIVVGWDERLNLPSFQIKNKKSLTEVRYENFNDPSEITYVSIVDVVKMVKTDKNNSDYRKEVDVTYEKIFWKENNPEYTAELKKKKDTKSIKSEKYKYYFKVRKKEVDSGWEDYIPKRENPYGCIPVIKIDQNKLSSDKSGYSDASGLINIASVYHQILEGAIDTNIYNGKPTTVFTGLNDAKKFITSMYGEIDPASGQVIEMGAYEMLGAYYLEGTGRMEYVQINDTVGPAKELLQLLFYIYVQVSGVPEWAFGAHINGTWASTKMQSTPLMQKIDSKRMSLNEGLLGLNYCIAKISEANNDIKYSSYITENEWGKTLPEDRDYIIQAIETVIPKELLSDETILTLLDIVDNPKEEIAKRKKEMQENSMDNSDKQAILDKIKAKIGEGGEMSSSELSSILISMIGEDDYNDIVS